MKNLLLHFLVAFVGLYLATLLVPGVYVEGEFVDMLKTLVFAAIVLGAVDYFVRPIVDLVTFPLRMITFGIFGLVLNMVIIEGVDIVFPSLFIVGLFPLFWSSLIIWFVMGVGSNLIKKI